VAASSSSPSAHGRRRPRAPPPRRMDCGGLELLPLSAWTAATSAPVSCFSFAAASALMRLQHSVLLGSHWLWMWMWMSTSWSLDCECAAWAFV
jgi:hypothetical protein